MALLTLQDVPAVGVDNVSLVAAAGGGDTAPAGPTHELHVKNAGGSPVTVTVTTPGTVDGLAITDIVRTVPATTGYSVIPLRERLVGSVAAISYSGVTSVTVGVVRVAS